MTWLDLAEANEQKIRDVLLESCEGANNNPHLYFKVFFWNDGDVTTLETHNQSETLKAINSPYCIPIATFYYPFDTLTKDQINKKVNEAWESFTNDLNYYYSELELDGYIFGEDGD